VEIPPSGYALILNPSFEVDIDGDGIPDKWTWNGTGGALSTEESMRGNQSFKVSGSGTLSSDPFSVSEEYEYMVYVASKSVGDKFIEIEVDWLDGDLNTLSTSEVWKGGAFKTWKYIGNVVTSPSNSRYAILKLIASGSGTVYWDDVRMLEPSKVEEDVTTPGAWYWERWRRYWDSLTQPLNPNWDDICGKWEMKRIYGTYWLHGWTESLVQCSEVRSTCDVICSDFRFTTRCILGSTIDCQCWALARDLANDVDIGWKTEYDATGAGGVYAYVKVGTVETSVSVTVDVTGAHKYRVHKMYDTCIFEIDGAPVATITSSFPATLDLQVDYMVLCPQEVSPYTRHIYVDWVDLVKIA